MKNIVIVAHKFLTQPDDELVVFLNDKKYFNVLHIKHGFSDADNRCSYFSWYKDGVLHREERTKDYKGWFEPLIYLKEFFFTCKWVMRAKFKWDYYIGMDGLCVCFGNFLRFFKKIDRTVFWAIDFVPEKRFDSQLKNKIYRLVNKAGYKRSDETWDVSPRMMRAREDFLNIKPGDYKKHKVVPGGAWNGRIKKYDYDECEKNTLVFMGHLLPKQGVQLVISAIPEIVKKMPDFKFKIIGDGSYKEILVKLAAELGVSKYCDFRGKIDDIEQLENEIARSCVAIAPYIKKLDTWTYYADPGKVKTYLACGIPVLLTGIPWNAEEIENLKCGKIITEAESDIVGSITQFMTDAGLNREYRLNAIKYAERFDYNMIFNDLW